MLVTDRGPAPEINKVPLLTFSFWLIKVAATTLGETGGDAVSMSMNLGYLLSTIIFASIFLIAVFIQVKSKKYNPVIYWFTIIATTTVGTTLADFTTRSLGIGYTGGSVTLLLLLLGSFAVWFKVKGSVSMDSINNTNTEIFYWITIMFSQTLGTALGDWAADSMALGYSGAAIVFGSLLALVVGLYIFTKTSRIFLFWAAFILTRPLGAVLGDFLDKPIANGGLALSRYLASLVLAGFIIFCLYITTRKNNLPRMPFAIFARK